MTRQIPQDHNYVTECPSPIKGKITQLENAAMDYAFIGTQDPADHAAITEYAQVSRYELERTILTHLEKRTSERIENAAQAASETHSSWESRCYAILAALNLNFGPTPEEQTAAMTDEADNPYRRRVERLEATVDDLHRQLREARNGPISGAEG